MRLLHRMGFQLRADAHGVMDEIEDPSLLMKQHLREAELELDRKRARLEALDEEARRLGEATLHEQKQIERLDQDVELALQGDKQDLARFALRRLLPHRRTFEALTERRDEIADEREHHARILSGQEQSFAQLRERVQARLASLDADWIHPACSCDDVAEEEIELELLRRRHASEPENDTAADTRLEDA